MGEEVIALNLWKNPVVTVAFRDAFYRQQKGGGAQIGQIPLKSVGSLGDIPGKANVE